MSYRRIAFHQRRIANSKHLEAVLNQAAQRNRARKYLRAKQVERRKNIWKKLRVKLLWLEILAVIMLLASSFSFIIIILGNDSIWIDLTGLVIIMSFIVLLIQNKRLRKLF